MRQFIFPILIILLSSSCFTAQLLDSNIDLSSVPADSYSFYRAYYSKDSLLHIDFNNLKNNNGTRNYYSITVDINAIVNEYDKYAKDNVLFNRQFSRKYLVTDARTLIYDSACNIGYNYTNTPLLNFGDVKARYTKTLETLTDSSLMVYVNILNDNCILKPTNNRRYNPEPPINYPKDVYILQTPADPDRYVALRIPLINGNSKLALLPFTIFLDVVTSPIQFGFYVLSHKSDDNNAENKHHRNDNTKPAPFHPTNPQHH